MASLLGMLNVKDKQPKDKQPENKKPEDNQPEDMQSDTDWVKFCFYKKHF